MPEDPRILELRQMRAKALAGGGAERIQKQKAKGKRTARERIQSLLCLGIASKTSTPSPKGIP